MGAVIAAVPILLFCVGLGTWLGVRIARRSGQPLQRRNVIILAIAGIFMTAIGTAVAASFAAGKPGIGVGLLIAVYIVPTLVLTPFRIRQSRRAAEAARAARMGRETSP